MLVQNRVNIVLPRLPEDVRRLGVVTTKNTPDILMVVHIYSPDSSRDQLYLSNYTLQNIRDRLVRLDGVGDIRLFGAREYSMRVWLDPQRIASFGMTAGEVVQALRGQNVQVAGGVLDRPPSTQQGAFETSVQLLGRLTDPAQFGDVLLKSGSDGRLVRVRDIGRIELGAVDYSTNAYLDDKAAVAIPVFQRPGSNALATAQRVQELMASLRPEFPPGLDYDIVYNPSEFIGEAVTEVQTTIYEAAILVVLVIVVFLQSWRASVIPLLAIPVSLIGTFAVLQASGFSLNTLSLFGLVLRDRHRRRRCDCRRGGRRAESARGHDGARCGAAPAHGGARNAIGRGPGGRAARVDASVDSATGGRGIGGHLSARCPRGRRAAGAGG